MRAARAWGAQVWGARAWGALVWGAPVLGALLAAATACQSAPPTATATATAEGPAPALSTSAPPAHQAPAETTRPVAHRTKTATRRPAVHRTARPAARPSARPSSAPPATRAAAVPAAVPECAHVVVPVGTTRVVRVRGAGTRATVEACRRSGSRWVRDLGPYSGHVGYGGVAGPGAKREGDGRTPSGTFALGTGFGTRADPGIVTGWRPARSGDVWVDDSRSSLYNTWQRGPARGRWRSAERLDQRGPYAYAQVIAYNTARAPGRGSAIFLHVDTGGATAGCVSLPTPSLLRVLRWERRGTVIQIS